MAEAVYLLCALTSVACTVLLLRAYWRTGSRLLLWSGAGFLGLALDNVLLFVDLVVFTSVDLSAARKIPSLLGLMLLIYGLVWEEQ